MRWIDTNIEWTLEVLILFAIFIFIWFTGWIIYKFISKKISRLKQEKEAIEKELDDDWFASTD